MSIPHIVVKRHDVSLYEWQVLYGQEKVDGDAGESSISECLTSGIGSIPESETLVEVSYRGIHMGTFAVQGVQEYPEEVAERIVDLYAKVINKA
jgi:hypothetical protein